MKPPYIIIRNNSYWPSLVTGGRGFDRAATNWGGRGYCQQHGAVKKCCLLATGGYFVCGCIASWVTWIISGSANPFGAPQPIRRYLTHHLASSPRLNNNILVQQILFHNFVESSDPSWGSRMSKLTFWQTIDLSRKSIIIQSSPEDFLALGKAFPFITSLWCLLRNLISIILWKHCGQILLICRNKIQNGKRRKGKEGRCHSWRWSCPRRPFLWGEAQVSFGFMHKLVFVKWKTRR